MARFQCISKIVVAVLCAAGMIALLASPARAHDPIFITADQTTPDTGPYMPDGSISWALYGSVLFDGDTRGFEFDLREGEDLIVSLLIPNLSPELELADAELPVLDLELPDGNTMQIVPNMREIFDEPFSNTSYVTLAELSEPGLAGRYRGIITGGAAARFSVAIGINEIFFTETERSGDRPSNFMEISEPLGIWYSTLPGEEPSAGGLADGEAEIQMDLIDEAMGSGVAQAPEEALADSPEEDSAEEDSAEESSGAQDEVAGAAAEELATTSGTSTEESGSGLTWIAPVAIGVLALAGAAAFARRSR